MLRHLLAVALGGYVLLQMNVMAMPAYDRRASVCNGHPELCGRSYGNVTYLTCMWFPLLVSLLIVSYNL